MQLQYHKREGEGRFGFKIKEARFHQSPISDHPFSLKLSKFSTYQIMHVTDQSNHGDCHLSFSSVYEFMSGVFQLHPPHA